MFSNDILGAGNNKITCAGGAGGAGGAGARRLPVRACRRASDWRFILTYEQKFCMKFKFRFF